MLRVYWQFKAFSSAFLFEKFNLNCTWHLYKFLWFEFCAHSAPLNHKKLFGEFLLFSRFHASSCVRVCCVGVRNVGIPCHIVRTVYIIPFREAIAIADQIRFSILTEGSPYSSSLNGQWTPT